MNCEIHTPQYPNAGMSIVQVHHCDRRSNARLGTDVRDGDHRKAMQAGRDGIFSFYRIRVGAIEREYGIGDENAPAAPTSGP